MVCGTVIRNGDGNTAQLGLNLRWERVESSADRCLKVSSGMDRRVRGKVWARIRCGGSLSVAREPVDFVLERLEGLLIHAFDVIV
jgi:hypothetical protein